MIVQSAAPIGYQDQIPASLRNPTRTLAIILCIAGVLRILSIFALRTYLHADTWEFGIIAHTITSGHGYTTVFPDGVRVPSAYMPPFYPYLLATVWRVFGEGPHTYLLIELLQAALGVLLVFYVYLLSKLLFSSRTALIAAGFVSVWPALVYLCNEFHSISLYILLGVASVYYLIRYIERSRSWVDAFRLGLCMGALFYCRGETIYLLTVYVVILVWRCGRKSIGHAATVAIIALLCILPWTLRNYRVFGHLLIVSTASGSDLWIGHNPRAQGNAAWDPLTPTPDQNRTLRSLMGKPDTEILINQQAAAYAFDFARNHPLQEVKLTTKKAFYFLFFDPFHKKARKPAYWLPSLMLLVMALYGAWHRRHRLIVQELPITAMVCFAFLLSLAVFALPRYRIAIDPFLAMYAANAAVPLFQKVRAFV